MSDHTWMRVYVEIPDEIDEEQWQLDVDLIRKTATDDVAVVDGRFYAVDCHHADHVDGCAMCARAAAAAEAAMEMVK